MPHSSKRKTLNRGTKVTTKDGTGTIIGFELRKNTNGGPGTWQYRIMLDDGRIRHYTKAIHWYGPQVVEPLDLAEKGTKIMTYDGMGTVLGHELKRNKDGIYYVIEYKIMLDNGSITYCCQTIK